MTIIGIDPGYDRLGWAIINAHSRKLTVLKYGCIQTDKNNHIFSRYQQIITEFNQIIVQHQPRDAAIETLFFSKNQKTALRVSETRGLIIGQLLQHDCHVFEYSPQAVKITVTGYGRADKPAIEKMIRTELDLPPTKIIDDTLDALAVAMTHGLTANSPGREHDR